MTGGSFRQYLYPHEHPRLASIRGLDAYEYADAAKYDAFTGGLIRGWEPLQRAPFIGITEDGRVRNIHHFSPAQPGEEAPVPVMVAAAERLIEETQTSQRERLWLAVDAPEWQTWANPEFMQFDTGLRLENQPARVREAALALVRASLSVEGYELVHQMMLINQFLGEIVDLPKILNEFSYNITIYGTPHLSNAWGWQLFGHHVAVNCLVVGGRMTVSPLFLGAEPDQLDSAGGGPGPFSDRIELGLRVMQALTPEQRDVATVYNQMVDPAMPPGRVHPGDERHLAGAFQDNRIIPPEGIRVREIGAEGQRLVLEIADTFNALLPAGPRTARSREVAAHLDETWFCWIGGHADGDVFYYRIQSPVIICELDHHCGVFLNYDTPKPFHIHTVLRTPNGNDYGRAWVKQSSCKRREAGY